jgi:hypothetical protein
MKDNNINEIKLEKLKNILKQSINRKSGGIDNINRELRKY